MTSSPLDNLPLGNLSLTYSRLDNIPLSSPLPSLLLPSSISSFPPTSFSPPPPSSSDSSLLNLATEKHVTLYGLPLISVEERSLEVELESPSSSSFGEIVEMVLKITNRAGYLQKFNVAIKETDDFLLSGDISKQIAIENGATAQFEFHLVGRALGKRLIPEVSINYAGSDKIVWESGGGRSMVVVP